MRSSDIPPRFLSVNDHLYPAKNIAVLISEQKTIIIELANIESSQVAILHTNLRGRMFFHTPVKQFNSTSC